MSARTLAVVSVSVGICYFAGRWVMFTTNPEIKDGNVSYEDNRLRQIRDNQSNNAKIMASANKQRLQALLDEVRNNKDEERYKAALKFLFRGITLVAHSGDVSISNRER